MSRILGASRPNRSYSLSSAGMKAVVGCEGRWPEPCREAWPVSRFAWCRACDQAYEAEKEAEKKRGQLRIVR